VLTKTTYPLNIALIRMGLTTAQDSAGGLAKPRMTQAAGFGTYRLAHTDTPVTIIYRLNDLYIDGFIPGDGTGNPFLFKSSTFSHATPNKLAFDGDYRALGLNRNAAFKMNIDGVNGAVIALHNVRTLDEANGLKEYYWKLAVAFAEAVRFDDVLESIVNDKPIDDLDWSKHKRVDKIRVLKS
jgi:hypothetical protein